MSSYGTNRRHGSAAAVKKDFGNAADTGAARRSNGQSSSTESLPILKNLSIIPVSKVPNDSSKITNSNKKEIRPALCQSKGLLVSSNLKISKEITITPINNVENNMMSNLKKLPDITFHIVRHEPVNQVPEYPTLNPKNFYGPDNKSKPILERRVFSEIQGNRIEKSSNFQKPSLLKPEKKPIKDNTTLKKNNHTTIISKNEEKIPNKYLYSDVKNIKTQENSCLNKVRKQSLNFPNINSKNLNTIKSVEKTSNTSTISLLQKVKKKSDKNSDVSNIENKAHESENEDYLSSDLPFESQIVTAPHMFDFINVSLNLPNYNSPYVYNDISTRPLIQDNHTTDTWTAQEDDQLLEEIRSYFCDNSIGNDTEFETKPMEFTENSHEILLSNVQGSSFMNSVENKIGIKRWQPQNEFQKKVKPDHESIL